MLAFFVTRSPLWFPNLVETWRRNTNLVFFRILMWTPLALNPLNAELNPICHLLVLLGDLMFMGPCIVSLFQYISNKMQRYTIYVYLETAVHVSVGTPTHHQERIQLDLQHLVFVTPLLLSDTIVEELEPVWVCCGWRVRCVRFWWWVGVPPETCRAVSRYK
jgi:hypothetical protein